ncbi:unnamed protein product, partial [Acanthoscelides obtectus]
IVFQVFEQLSFEAIFIEGVLQGGGLSPLLYIVFMDDLIRQCRQGRKAIFVGYRKLHKVESAKCAFADDFVLVAGSIQENLNIWNTVLEDNDLVDSDG